MSQAVYVRTARVPLDELTPFPGNAKRGDVPTILASLRRTGQYRSLVVREIPNGPRIVLAGNHTMQAFETHGAGDCGETVTVGTSTRPCGVCQNEATWEPGARCEIVACDDDTARRINLVDNRSAELGDYDRDALTELLAEVGEDYGGTGYTEADHRLLTAPAPSLDELSDTYGDPAEDDFWPVLKLKISPDDRDTFYGLTIECADPNDDAERFRYLLGLSRGTEAAAATG
jgi:hypothetical protein